LSLTTDITMALTADPNTELLVARQHIQNHSEAAAFELHWGYPDRVVPCTNDAGSCSYLDAVYWMHDVSILYSWIMWVVIGIGLAVWLIIRVLVPQGSTRSRLDSEAVGPAVKQGIVYRSYRAVLASGRRWLLPEALIGWFGHVSILQIAILAGLCIYLILFS